jgi:hypothetical protein
MLLGRASALLNAFEEGDTAMCMMVYLAADEPLPVVPWDEQQRAFHVSPLSVNEECVRKQFSQRFVVYVGSHEGCGCGFQCGPYPPDTYEAAEIEARRRSLRQFADYVDAQLRHCDSIAVFACWDGDQGDAPGHGRELVPAHLRDPGFYFLERELSVFRSAPILSPTA